MFGIFKKKPVIQSPAQQPAPAAPPVALPAKRLVEQVQRVSDAEAGPLENINRDLGAFVEKHFPGGDPLALMAYAYARRSAIAGLFFQRYTDQNVFMNVQSLFKGFQAKTGQTVAFQEEASAQADELIKAYVPQLSEQHTRAMLQAAFNGITAVDMGRALGFNVEIIGSNPVALVHCIEILNEHLVQTAPLDLGHAHGFAVDFLGPGPVELGPQR